MGKSHASSCTTMQAWLIPDKLPSSKACVCDICGVPLQFLLQVYTHFVCKIQIRWFQLNIELHVLILI